jgi:hypothetical protein
MPVYKRAARPTAASAPADPRDPQSSENEFTVLFDRSPARMRNFVPGAPGAPAVTRQVGRPPAVVEERERTTPIGIAVPGAQRIETVAVPAPLRLRLLRVSVLLTFGCMLGVGVERFVRSQISVSWSSRGGASATTEIDDLPEQAQQEVTAAPISIAEEMTPPAHATHHHHHHATAAATSAAASGVSDAAGAEDADDLAAAVQALTKAKEEVTLP